MKISYVLMVLLLLFACSSPKENPAVDGDQLVVSDEDQSDQTDQSDQSNEAEVSDQSDAPIPDEDMVIPVTCGNSATDLGEECDGDAKNCADIDASYTGGVAVCKEDCSGYDTASCQGGTDDDSEVDDETTDSDAAPDLSPDVDMNVWPECTLDGDCNSSTRSCYQGICRDKCTIYINECEWKPSGDICSGGLCVECLKDADCPGTRYTCDTTKLVCVDKPFDPSKTKIGVFYHTWHCPSAGEIHDVSKCLAGDESWPAWPSDPNAQTSFWWAEPQDGYYCLTDNTALLTKHAEMLRDMGADFVFVDVTNHNYNTSSLCSQPEAMIIQPFTSMVNVWKTITGAPKIVPWVPVSDCPTYFPADQCTHPDNTYIVYTLLNILAGTGMTFEYQGKPLIIVTENDTYPVSESKLSALSTNYTIRKMWANEADGTPEWSYMEKCDESPTASSPCFQRAAMLGGAKEQVPISTAYQADYMSHTTTATPKHNGKTFRKQFETLLDNPDIPIATITGWNEWIVGRWKCGSPACDCGNSFDATYGCFLDQYTYEYNRDIEPAKNDPLGDYYYRLVKSCIALFRAGGRCDATHANDLCCKD